MSRAVIYARYSSASQSSETIDVQVDVCRRYALRQGYKLSGDPYVDEARTGTTVVGRDAFSRMMDDGRAGLFDVVLVYMFDRLGRSFLEMVEAVGELETVYDIRVESATEINDPGVRNFFFSIADIFSRKLSERVRESMHARAREGTLKIRAPYGYTREGTSSSSSPTRPTSCATSSTATSRVPAAARSPRT